MTGQKRDENDGTNEEKWKTYGESDTRERDRGQDPQFFSLFN